MTTTTSCLCLRMRTAMTVTVIACTSPCLHLLSATGLVLLRRVERFLEISHILHYFTNILKEQYFYDAYDRDQMMHDSTRNDIVVKDSHGTIIQELGRPVVIDYWSFSGQNCIPMDYFVEYPEFCDILPDNKMDNNRILRFVSRFLNPLSTSFNGIRKSVENAYPNIGGIALSRIHPDTWEEATRYKLTKIREQNIY